MATVKCALLKKNSTANTMVTRIKDMEWDTTVINQLTIFLFIMPLPLIKGDVFSKYTCSTLKLSFKLFGKNLPLEIHVCLQSMKKNPPHSI